MGSDRDECSHWAGKTCQPLSTLEKNSEYFILALYPDGQRKGTKLGRSPCMLRFHLRLGQYGFVNEYSVSSSDLVFWDTLFVFPFSVS